ncbi:hypothetical protein GOP97_14810 [Vibrio cholerae]|uniref:hypothetical protein n=1 Tax=Vibrio cholerae TaxID=666 RepID=UPI002DB897FE|nr:hypothetical protein [Vibrio cholerae]MEB5557037.1 hypothetical protein [Vibrio cholerae]
MGFEIVSTKLDGYGRAKVVVGNGVQFFVMWKQPDGFFVRTTKDGLELKTKNLDYAAIGAKMFNSEDAARDSII